MNREGVFFPLAAWKKINFFYLKNKSKLEREQKT